MLVYLNNGNTSDSYSSSYTKDNKQTLEINLRKANETINKLSDENKLIWQELKDAKYEISLLEKQMSGLRTRIANIENKN